MRCARASSVIATTLSTSQHATATASSTNDKRPQINTFRKVSGIERSTIIDKILEPLQATAVAKRVRRQSWRAFACPSDSGIPADLWGLALTVSKAGLKPTTNHLGRSFDLLLHTSCRLGRRRYGYSHSRKYTWTPTVPKGR